ncbi:hypothetical protein H1V43_17045 [Streptomyces sp. PSKA54]|uniref:Uncharacterized protein n=1 Tax=Streptomyces himalayensis subsp. aureolus TaxID=2758039 RepID=A0A7W2HGM4_9ACTN|nr:hypothetical protein [Streptomyces himalayensis]MBA4863056.1 hypothetical protein [Streptomyces himalayensis subsp. aureolus]
MDLSQYAESYYFHDGHGDMSLARQVGYAAELAALGNRAQRPDVRASAAVLTAALEDLAGILDRWFLHTEGTMRQTFQAYARDHGGDAA